MGTPIELHAKVLTLLFLVLYSLSIKKTHLLKKMKEATSTRLVFRFIYMEKCSKMFYHHIKVDICSFSFAFKGVKISKGLI